MPREDSFGGISPWGNAIKTGGEEGERGAMITCGVGRLPCGQLVACFFGATKEVAGIHPTPSRAEGGEGEGHLRFIRSRSPRSLVTHARPLAPAWAVRRGHGPGFCDPRHREGWEQDRNCHSRGGVEAIAALGAETGAGGDPQGLRVPRRVALPSGTKRNLQREYRGDRPAQVSR